MDERRRHKRMNSLFYLRVFNRDTDRLAGRMVNITPKGIMLVSEEPIEPNKNFSFRMVLPEGFEGKKTITFNANSRWCMKDVNPDLYDTGFMLSDMTFEDAKVIEHLIEDYTFDYLQTIGQL